jgi:hypothetical protein
MASLGRGPLPKLKKKKRRKAGPRRVGLRESWKRKSRKLDRGSPDPLQTAAAESAPSANGEKKDKAFKPWQWLVGSEHRSSAAVRLQFGRTGGPGKPVMACATWGGGKGEKGAAKMMTECVKGRNPRVAMAGALRKLAGKMTKRGGVLAGLGLSGHRRRRRRR